MKRGINTIDDLLARSIVDPVTHCWHWQAAKIDGRPRIWTADLDMMDKRVLSGPRAVWYIAHGSRLFSLRAYMGCWTRDCVCPVHVRRGTQLQVNAATSRAGLLARPPGSCDAHLAKARIKAGHVDTPHDVVAAVRAAAGTGTGVELAKRFGVTKSVACRILRGQTYKNVGVA